MRYRDVVISEAERMHLSEIISRRDLAFGGPTADHYRSIERIVRGYDEAARTEFEQLSIEDKAE